MKFSIVALLATVVVADSCNRGGVYCGSSLLRKGMTLLLYWCQPLNEQ